MSYSVVVDGAFAGPPIADLLPVLDVLPDPIEVRWEGTPLELHAYETHKGRAFQFMVKDTKVLDKTLWALGGSVPLTDGEADTARTALVTRSGLDWRSSLEDQGYIRGMLTLTKLVGDSLRSGKQPAAACRVAIDCLIGGVNPVDADLLMRLRTKK